MNVVITGPFGYDSLADELVLAGLLRHLRRAKHDVTVFSADPELTAAIHGTELHTILMPDPTQILSNAHAWDALGRANLAILAGGGVINATGKPAARVWLSQLEHAQRVGVKTAVIGAGAVKVEEPRERARLQRLLHNCIDSVAVRDEASKSALMSYGLNANRISNNGDPILSLANEPFVDAVEKHQVGLLVPCKLPSREGFGPENTELSDKFAASVAGLVKGILAISNEIKIHLFYEHEEFEDKIQLSDDELKRIELSQTDIPIAELQSQVAKCGCVLSLGHHGVLLGAAAGAPVAGFEVETSTSRLLQSLGLDQYVATDFEAAINVVREMLDNQIELRAQVRTRVRALARKEAQNARLIELLVPRRQRPRVQKDSEAVESFE